MTFLCGLFGLLLFDPAGDVGNLRQDFRPLFLGDLRLLVGPHGHEGLDLGQLLLKVLDGLRARRQLGRAEPNLLGRLGNLGVLGLHDGKVGIIGIVQPLFGILGNLLQLLALLFGGDLAEQFLVVDELVLDLVDVALDLVLLGLEGDAFHILAVQFDHLCLRFLHHVSRVRLDLSDVVLADGQRSLQRALLFLLNLDGPLLFLFVLVGGFCGIGIRCVLLIAGGGFVSRLFGLFGIVLTFGVSGFVGFIVFVIHLNLLLNGVRFLDGGFGADEFDDAAGRQFELE
mmetsp:Transcript_23346/g.66147  ORF Transcript_23346/g.66147 Transcript_23346/m.66147 type:complete len:285 (+) Transcript_23346:1356-2210(+)